MKKLKPEDDDRVNVPGGQGNLERYVRPFWGLEIKTKQTVLLMQLLSLLNKGCMEGQSLTDLN